MNYELKNVSTIRSAHNVVSHSETTQILSPIRKSSPWSPNNRDDTYNYCNIMCPIHRVLVGLHNAKSM